MKKINYTDNTDKKFICVSSGYEPIQMISNPKRNVSKFWFQTTKKLIYTCPICKKTI